MLVEIGTTMKIEKIQHFKLKDIILISSLPDMGKVGGLVSGHFAKKLNVKLAAKLVLSDKPWVMQQGGLVNLPHDEYSIFVEEQKSVVIFTGDNQPQDGASVFEMCKILLSAVREMGNIKLVISSGGYIPKQPGNGDRIFGVATNAKLLGELRPLGVEILGPDINSITWFNGLVLGLAKEQNLDGVGLFGEIADTETPQYRAAKNIVTTIGRIIKMEIDTKELEGRVAPPSSELKKSSPGIG